MNEKTNVSEYGYNGASLKLDLQMFSGSMLSKYVVYIDMNTNHVHSFSHQRNSLKFILKRQTIHDPRPIKHG